MKNFLILLSVIVLYFSIGPALTVAGGLVGFVIGILLAVFAFLGLIFLVRDTIL